MGDADRCGLSLCLGGSSASPSSRQANCDGRLAASTTTGSPARARDGRTALLVLIQGGFQVRYAGSSSIERPLGYRLITPVAAACCPVSPAEGVVALAMNEALSQ